MQLRTALLSLAVACATVLLLSTMALVDLRAPNATAELAAALVEDDGMRDAVSEALVDAVLTDATDRSSVAGSLLSLIRPVLEQAASAAVDSPAGRAALTSALTDALRQLTFRGPIVIDLRAAALIAAETAPAPLDTLARAAVEQGSVGMVVIGGEPDDATSLMLAPPSDDELRRVAGLPSGVTIALIGMLLVGLIIVLIGRADRARPYRLILAGTPLVLIGTTGAALIGLAPSVVVDRLADSVTQDPGPLITVLPLLTDGLMGLLTSTATLAAVLAVVGVVLAAVGTRAVLGQPRRT